MSIRNIANLRTHNPSRRDRQRQRYQMDLSWLRVWSILPRCGSRSQLNRGASKRSGFMRPSAVVFVLVVVVLLSSFLPFTKAQAPSISIDSPYATKANVYKGQLHAHSTNSEGCNSPQEVATIYKNLGFDFTSITDHDYLTPDPEVAGILYIPGVEETTQPDVRHILSINASAEVTQTEPQSVINAIDAQGAIAIIAHPSFSAMTESDLQALLGYSMMEIDDESLWDGLLTANRRVFAVASDDSVCQSSLRNYGRGWVQTFADSLDRNSIIASLRSGNFYSSQGPTLSVSVYGTIITVATDSPSEIDWIGSGGVVLQLSNNATAGSYSVTGSESYVRIRVIRNNDYKKAWSNALWVSGKQPTTTTTTRIVQETSITTMNFHMYSVVYRSSDSIQVYNGADSNPPIQASPLIATVSCSSSISNVEQFLPLEYGSLLGGAEAWTGIVVWVTQPLADDITIRGTVNMTVWMNTPQPEVRMSAYALGIAEANIGALKLIGEPVYGYRASNGSVLGPSPQPYQVTLSVDRTLTKGNELAFVVAVAATTNGWRYQVYFDSQSMNSHVTLPVVAAVPISEFGQVQAAVAICVVLLLPILQRRTRSRSTDAAN
jgi:hypothetical protein